MIVAVVVIAALVALLIGFAIGYIVATRRTDILLADMSDEELKTLASRVRERKVSQ